MKQITSFRGLVNTSDQMRLDWRALVQADNVNITDTGAISKREGYELARAGVFTGAFSTFDYTRAYLVTALDIQTFDGESIVGLTSSAPMFWAEANNHVYYNNGVDSGVIAPDNTVALWRGAPVSYGAGFVGDDGLNRAVLFDTLPSGTDVIQFWKGRMYAAQHMPADDQTAIWFSEAMGYHMFNLDSNFILVPGKVLMLAPHDGALIIGTEARVYAYSGDKLEQLADYGVVPGQHWSRDDAQTLFWTVRGLCAALPFANLTERQASVAPGISAGGTVMYSGGQRRYLAVLEQGGAPFNSRLPVAVGTSVTYHKDPDATTDFLFDWSDYLAPDADAIAGVQWFAELPLVVGSSSNTATTATAVVSGGVVGTQKKLTCRVTTVAGFVDDRSITIVLVNL